MLEEQNDDPLESDRDQDDDLTMPCPYCRQKVYEGAEFCPYCRRYLSIEDAPWRKPLWIIVTVIICLLIVLLCWVL